MIGRGQDATRTTYSSFPTKWGRSGWGPLRNLCLTLAFSFLTACSADMTGIEFPALVRPSTPNTYLVCPPDLCAVPPDAESPTFQRPADQLYNLIRRTLTSQPRTTVAQEEPDR